MEKKSKRKIEVFTAGCPVCEPVVEMVKSLTCSDCDVTVYDLQQSSDNKVGIDLTKAYGIKALPSVAVNGKLFSCCQSNGITGKALRNAGIGEPLQ